MTEGCGCRVGRQFRHNEVAVLGAFAYAILALHATLGGCRVAECTDCPDHSDEAYIAARAAVRCARMLELREEYR